MQKINFAIAIRFIISPVKEVAIQLFELCQQCQTGRSGYESKTCFGCEQRFLTSNSVNFYRPTAAFEVSIGLLDLLVEPLSELGQNPIEIELLKSLIPAIISYYFEIDPTSLDFLPVKFHAPLLATNWFCLSTVEQA